MLNQATTQSTGKEAVLENKQQQDVDLAKENQVHDLNVLFGDREPLRLAFVERVGWGDARIETMGEDCAFRRYYRLTKPDGSTALVMDSILELEDKVAPAHKLRDVVKLSPMLKAAGLNVPEVYESDLEKGYALIEDFGDYSFNDALSAGENEEELYTLATRILKTFKQSDELQNLDLNNYYDTHVHANRVDIVHWYRPAALYEANPDGLVDSYLAAWDEIESALPPCPKGFTHCDFHVDNLMVLEGKEGLERIGLLDFQGAVSGPLPYDLANLLEDARKTLPKPLKAKLKDLYCEGMSAEERDVFDAWYRVLATQFHCRVIGLFVRLLVRDNKDIHLHHVPRLQNYIVEALEDPIMAPLARWFEDSNIDLSKPLPAFDLPKLRGILGLK